VSFIIIPLPEIKYVPQKMVDSKFILIKSTTWICLTDYYLMMCVEYFTKINRLHNFFHIWMCVQSLLYIKLCMFNSILYLDQIEITKYCLLCQIWNQMWLLVISIILCIHEYFTINNVFSAVYHIRYKNGAKTLPWGIPDVYMYKKKKQLGRVHSFTFFFVSNIYIYEYVVFH
jgi:hypothetical protein